MSFENIAVLDNRLILIKEIDIRVPISSFIDSSEEQCFTVNIDDPELIHICIFKEALTGYKSEDSGFVYKRFLEKLLQSSKVTIEHKSIFHQWNLYGLCFEKYKGREPTSEEKESYYARSFERINERLNNNKDILWRQYREQMYFQPSDPFLESFNKSAKILKEKCHISKK